MLKDFYVAFSPTCFSLLGLWFVVIQINAGRWLAHDWHLRWACAVALYFAAPGAMSLFALIDTQSSTLWRISFAIVSLSGLVAAIRVGPVKHQRSSQRPDGKAGTRPHKRIEQVDHLMHWLAIVLYAAIAVLAYPTLHTLRIEGGLLTVLVLVGLYVALRLMIMVGPPATDTSGAGAQAPS
jgi:hypothetical protein